MKVGLPPLLFFGFGILVSLWPFHTWAPLGYGSAPAATAMLHAGVLKKFGLYGLIRVALPLAPEGAKVWVHIIAWLALGNILHCGWVAMRQRDLVPGDLVREQRAADAARLPSTPTPLVFRSRGRTGCAR